MKRLLNAALATLGDAGFLGPRAQVPALADALLADFVDGLHPARKS